MHLPKFEYFEPRTLEEACSLLDKYRGRAKVIAGGTDLIVQMKQKALSPPYLVNLKQIPGLSDINYDESEGLRIGALVTHRAISASAIIREKYNVLASASGKVGSVQVQNIATIGGNICNASPAADTAPALIGLGAELKVLCGKGERVISLGDFFRGPGETVLGDDEIVTEIRVPNIEPYTGAVYLKHGLRKAMDLAIVGVAVMIRLDSEKKKSEKIHIVLGAVAPTPMRAERAEWILQGKKIDDDLVEKAAQEAALECRPISDVQSSAEYRKEMIEVFTGRAIQEALKVAEAL